MKMISIYVDGKKLKTVNAFIGAPTEARTRQGLIRMGSTASGEQGKHILYSLTQRALVEKDDNTLEILWQPDGTEMKADYDDLETSFTEGAILMMEANNRIAVMAHENVNITAMLREFHRYATRMIRLDVR